MSLGTRQGSGKHRRRGRAGSEASLPPQVLRSLTPLLGNPWPRGPDKGSCLESPLMATLAYPGAVGRQ